MTKQPLSEFKTRRVITLTNVALGVFWSALIVVVLMASVPEHAVGVTLVTKSVTKSFLPEGWSFFTRNPREATDKFYEQRSDGTLVPGNAADVRGFPVTASRADRVRSIELSMVMAQVPKEAWVSCEEAVLSDCLKTLPKEPVKVAVSMHDCSYRGLGVVQKSTPVPWAWRRSFGHVRIPSKVVRLDVDCKQL